MVLTEPRIATILAYFKSPVKDFWKQNTKIWLKIRVFRQRFKWKVKEVIMINDASINNQ